MSLRFNSIPFEQPSTKPDLTVGSGHNGADERADFDESTFGRDRPVVGVVMRVRASRPQKRTSLSRSWASDGKLPGICSS